MFNYLIGNGDAHGKNFSLLYNGEEESLAPFYDLMCTLVYGDSYKGKMAMKIGSKYKFNDMSLRQFDKVAEMISYKPSFVRKQFADLAKKIAVESVNLADSLNKNPATVRWSWFVGQESGEVKLQILGLSLVYVMPLVSCFVSAGAGRIVSAEP